MDRSDVTLERMRTFVRVAERGNLSAVARELQIGQSSVTRHLRELEQALGVALLSRTTRSVTLTDEGRRYYADAVHVLHLVDLATDEARSGGRGASGTVRISCTAALGVRHISRLLFELQDRHPEIAIDLSLTDDRIDLVAEGTDVAIRLGPLADTSMKLRPLGASRRVLVASPDYLARYGRPMKPSDLTGHEAILMSNIAGSDAITLENPDGNASVTALRGRFHVDHGLAAREACLQGRGIAIAHIWLIDDLLSDGRLETILQDHVPSSVPLNMLIVPERGAIARVRLVVEFIAQRATDIPGVERIR
jgi:DNA-binding transcriptional LysR family regulator